MKCERILVEIVVFARGGSLSAQISGGKGRSSRRLKSRKLQVKSSHEVVT